MTGRDRFGLRLAFLVLSFVVPLVVVVGVLSNAPGYRHPAGTGIPTVDVTMAHTHH